MIYKALKIVIESESDVRWDSWCFVSKVTGSFETLYCNISDCLKRAKYLWLPVPSDIKSKSYWRWRSVSRDCDVTSRMLLITIRMPRLVPRGITICISLILLSAIRSKSEKPQATTYGDPPVRRCLRLQVTILPC